MDKKNNKWPLLVNIYIADNNHSISRVELQKSPTNEWQWRIHATGQPEKELVKQIEKWMHAYSKGKTPTFSLPLAPIKTTPFLQKAWTAMQQIPVGTTVSYQELAAKCGSKRAYRAIGSACRRNPWPLLVPCHRVVASDGGLGGYLGGLEMKISLLEHEKSFA